MQVSADAQAVELVTGELQGALLMNLGYTYDVNVNITKIEDFVMGSPQTQTFTYDSIDRLASGQASGGTGGNYPQESYTYNSTTGNLVSKAGTNLTYNASVSCSAGNRPIPHAASAFGGSTYSYDCNGNMSGRTVSGAASTLSYNAENRLVSTSGAVTASFIYDGDGNRVKSVVGGVTMVTIGDFFEWTGSTSTMKSYYYAGGARVAVRTGSSLNWIMGDHLGSTSVVTDANGTLYSKQLYKAWGEMRFSSGTLPTDYKYTGQREEAAQGLYDYKARFYDPVLGRFLQADSIVPGAGNPSAWDRYAYVLNNPTRYTDPSGHSPCFEDGFCVDGKYNAETHLSYLISLYGLAFSGKLPWSIDTMWSITKAVQTIGEKFSSILGLDPVSSFKSMYGVRWDRKFIFEMGCDECLGFGLTIGTRHIKFRDFYSDYFSNVTLGVHELGHAFENAMERTLGDGRKYKEARTTLPNHHVNNRQGLLPHWRWQHNLDPSPGEVFADTFIAFVFDKWDRSPLNINIANDRSVWMNDHMPRFIDTTMQNQGGGR